MPADRRRRARRHLARTLDAINRERREIEGGMREQALLLAEDLFDEGTSHRPPSACSTRTSTRAWSASWPHASRTSCTAPPSCLPPAARRARARARGSGRSPGFHLRDALDLVAKRHPGVLLRFGGHAMAAGCTVPAERFADFEQALALVAREWLDAATLTRRLETDGPWPRVAPRRPGRHAAARVWGQGFAPPCSAKVDILSQRLVGERHLSLKLRHRGEPVDGIWFGRTRPAARALLAWRAWTSTNGAASANCSCGGRRAGTELWRPLQSSPAAIRPDPPTPPHPGAPMMPRTATAVLLASLLWAGSVRTYR